MRGGFLDISHALWYNVKNDIRRYRQMKKSVLAAALAGVMLFSGCSGSWIHQWKKGSFRPLQRCNETLHRHRKPRCTATFLHNRAGRIPPYHSQQAARGIGVREVGFRGRCAESG